MTFEVGKKINLIYEIMKIINLPFLCLRIFSKYHLL